MSEPLRIPIVTLIDELPASVDLYACSASFEDRSLVIAREIARVTPSDVIVFQTDSIAHSTSNTASLRSIFAERARVVTYRRGNPLDIADRMQSALFAVGGVGRRIVVDITTFTHEALLILVRLLRDRVRPDDRVWFAYARAKEYSIGAPSEEKWLSKGVREIRSVLGFAGETLPSRRTHLIVLAGFEKERAARLVDEYEPAQVSVGLVMADVAERDGHYTANRAFQSVFLEKYATADRFYFDCYKVESTMAILTEQVDKYPGLNVVIAPLNTKISTVAAGLAALRHGGIQMAYAFANQYNFSAYSAPDDTCFVWEATAQLRAAVSA